MSARDAATRLLAIGVVKARIAEEEKRLRAELAGELVTGERVPGVIDPGDAEGTALGFVTKKKGSSTARVTDPAALLAWAKEHVPTEVQTTEAVRGGFLPVLLDAVKAHGGWPDANGEVQEVAGVEVRETAPGLMVKANDAADRLVAEALAGQRLALLPGEGAGE